MVLTTAAEVRLPSNTAKNSKTKIANAYWIVFVSKFMIECFDF